ncbi:MAG: hypothetical protein AABZ32_10150 [Bacteroidota bacterium]
MELTIKIDDGKNYQMLVDFLKSLKISFDRELSETKKSKFKSLKEFHSLAGLWKDRNISLESADSVILSFAPVIKFHASAIEENSSVIEEDSLAIEEDSSAIEEDSSAIEEDSSTIEEDSSAIEEDSSAIEEDSSAIRKHSKINIITGSTRFPVGNYLLMY